MLCGGQIQRPRLLSVTQGLVRNALRQSHHSRKDGLYCQSFFGGVCVLHSLALRRTPLAGFLDMKKSILLNGIVVGEVVATGDLELDAKAAHEFLGKKGLLKERAPAEEIFSTAFAFANTSAYLHENGLKKQLSKGASIVPFVVNAAFAIELYFKALAQKHHVTLRGHELLKLYKGLPQEALKEIEQVIPGCASDRKIASPNFVEYLKELNSAFVDWRYIFEKSKSGPIHIEPTIFVMQVLHEAFRSPQKA